ncbi:uncharacterized protein A1O9_11507 [Exophiala aquamarina CBS 119918]|uniref:C2H2-type domain-containing protein n=1 Tax=Exophiala aquamarina CBS 119918 TaxID=1182545 RepID=A0A072NY04_9EURO|nr:uncharacterized protein A1O9_11507 [Exophiala aquamarina CBS 119918]KEF52267.1 hypothetical protein A1O9_11507 [Exophiala aquamarina CBS 119918]
MSSPFFGSRPRNTRHMRKTGLPQSWLCEFCKKTYHRSDVLRRHYVSCPHRNGRQIPDRLPRGRRKQACDLCARTRVSCDLDSPCENCLFSGSCCTYLRTERTARSPSTLSTGNYGSLRSAPRQISNETGSTSHKIRISFLLNWSSPTSGLTDTFKRSSDDVAVHANTRSQSQDDTTFYCKAGGSESYGYSPSWLSLVIPLTSPHTDYLPLFLTPDNSLINLELCADASALPFPSSELGMHDQLSSTAFLSLMDGSQYPDQLVGMDRNISIELADQLTALTLSLPHDHPEHAPSIHLALGMRTLTQNNISIFLQLYFQHWNRHSPVVHPGTFGVFRTPLPLLLVMTLTGALFSLAPGAVTTARSMLELAEEFAFSDPDFQRIASGIFPEGLEQRRRALKALQAAFCAVQLQLREGTTWKRKCMRTVRFDQIISAVRTMALHNGDFLLPDNSTQETGISSWYRFAENESRLRLLCGIFHLDVAISTIYGERPRLFYHELHVGMPCSPNVFMAETVGAYYEALACETGTGCYSLPGTIAAFAGNRTDLLPDTESFNLLYLFSVLFGLIQIIQSHLHCDSSVELGCRLGKGLQLWKAKWDASILQIGPSQLETSGFLKDAGPEFWHFACYLLTTRGETAPLEPEANPSSTSEASNIFNRFLQSVKALR